MNKDCIAMVGLAPVISVQCSLEYLKGYTIPNYHMPSSLVSHYMQASQEQAAILVCHHRLVNEPLLLHLQ